MRSFLDLAGYRVMCVALLFVAVCVGGATAQTYTTSGTGFIVASSGYILTAYHIVEGATGPITVTLSDGRKLEAQVVGYSPAFEDGGYDAALLKIPATGLPTIPLGDSDAVQLFDQAIVLGYPLSFELGVSLNITGGNITAFRDLEDSPPLLQIDAAVNAGNSGGPVLDESGYAIGMVASKLVGETIEGVSFAVPISNAIKLVSKYVPGWSAAPPGSALTSRQIASNATPAVVYVEWEDVYSVGGQYEETFAQKREWYAEYWNEKGYIEIAPKEERSVEQAECPAEATGPFFEVDILFAKCKDANCAAGIAFYAAEEDRWSYLLLISPDSTYAFYKISPTGSTWTTVTPWQESRKIKSGLNVVNRIAIEAGDKIAFLSVNGERVGSLNTVLSLGGSIALCVVSFDGKAAARFDNLRIYGAPTGTSDMVP
ncbi:MAG: trypsin-like peptidase domain-containing protein [Candidatus Bipolaricaulis sp.]|nr:trypsin-like peptidase domain-containing protein [Candidatus Bipolaricaulis sp.]